MLIKSETLQEEKIKKIFKKIVKKKPENLRLSENFLMFYIFPIIVILNQSASDQFSFVLNKHFII